MEKEIKVTVNIEEQKVTGLDIPKEINPVETAKLFTFLSLKMLEQIQVERKDERVVPVKSKIVTP